MLTIRIAFMVPIESRSAGVQQIGPNSTSLTPPNLDVADRNLKSDLEVANCEVKI